MKTNYENEKMNSSGWMTIPEWASVRQVDVCGREREAENLPRADASENFHVLVRGMIELPDEYELLVAADDHYQLWIDGAYRGQGPSASCSDRCYYDSYSIGKPEASFGSGKLTAPFESQVTDQDDNSLFAVPVPQTQLQGAENSRNDNSGLNCEMGLHKVTIALHLYYHGRISRSWTSGDGRFGVWASVRKKKSSASRGDGLQDNDAWEELAHCDESWRYLICTAYSGETVGYDTQFLENFDSRCWPEGWEKPEFDVDDNNNIMAESWGHLVPAIWADYEMMPRPIQMLEEKMIYPVAHTRWKCLLAEMGGLPVEASAYQESATEHIAIDKKTPCLDGAAVPFQDAAREDALISDLLDFGREITGAILAEAAGPAGAQVVIRYGEELEEVHDSAQSFDTGESDTLRLGDTGDSDTAVFPDTGKAYTARPTGGNQPGELTDEAKDCSINQSNVRWDMRCGCAYQEVWTLGEGISRFHPYDYKGFRYVQLVYPETVEIREVSAWVRHYPMEEDACTLKCDEAIPMEDAETNALAAQAYETKTNIEMAGMIPADNVGSLAAAVWPEKSDYGVSGADLEQIFEICKNAVRCCSQDGYLDCPTREKGQYLGDALITGRSQVWLTGSTELMRKCIDDFIASQSISPSMMAVAPGSVMQEIADFSLLFPLLPLTDYEFTADKDYLARCYPAVKRLTESFLIYQRPDGLLENVGDLWNLVDWPENLRDDYDFPLTRPVVGDGCHNVINALWYGANQMQEQMEHLLGLPAVGRTVRIAPAYRTAFYREKQHLFADSEKSGHCSLHANLYAAYFGLLPQEAENAYLTLLQTPGRVCGALPTYFALKSTAKIGRPDVCFRLMTRADAYGWRNMLREGASASFEAWGKNQKWNTSLCHGWSSGFIPLFIEEIAGLHPDPDIEGQGGTDGPCKAYFIRESAEPCKDYPSGKSAGLCKDYPSGESTEFCRVRPDDRGVGHCEPHVPGNAWSEFKKSEDICQPEGEPDGLRFSPPRIPGFPDFVLQVPWKGKKIRVVKHDRKNYLCYV
ncbi:MAG: family 78 glycoside hydrolase catalytic domain [Lachnospiraceae bacterium]|nr:family 78 glycoside hydrolase catalytic domain [Lachnospiraceae bacterium]